ncbi:hypothetical protein [Kitasatospora cathayae]|uniref:Uncharacterized protein n=1 Tax=Kitasatospora cathayae TaxID=3004092 RepID=A0ABY7QH30_9ACTN|nr:hypothetical protein [Kitasatospora sp. HUAS 3-15]WBP92033.1 hypothetical protein O1G21_40315 [Kitasatospora sp. HUAS 3-15]
MTTELDHLAAAAAPFARFTGYDPAAGRRRVAARIAALKQADRAEADTDAAGAAQPEHAVDADGLTFQQHAERDLRTLTTCVINESGAPELLQRLVNSRDIDPQGGLVFAALLYLSGHPRDGQFWFQFAAGSGDSTAAYCLYLHHAALGELRDAEHWYHQTAALMDRPLPDIPHNELPPPPSLPPVDAYLFNTPWHSQHLPADTEALHRPGPALRHTVDHLRTVSEEHLGPFVLPTETLAEQLHDLVCP